MIDLPGCRRANIVTYVDLRAAADTVFQRGALVGNGLTDPESSDVWLPVQLPEGCVDLLDPDFVVDITPDPSTPSVTDAVGLLRGAVAALTAEPCDDTDTARALVIEFWRTVEPIWPSLIRLAEAAPDGSIALAVHCLQNAAAHLRTENSALWRTAMLIALVALESALSLSEPAGHGW